MSFWGICFDSIIPCGRVDVHQWNSLSEHSPLLCCVRGALHQADLPRIVGPGWSWLHHPLWQESDEQGDLPHGYPHHWWGRQREPWNGDCLLLLWPGKDGAFGHAYTPCPTRHKSVGCGGFPWGSFGLPSLIKPPCHRMPQPSNFHFHSWTCIPPLRSSWPKEKEGNELTVSLITKEALLGSSVEDCHLSFPVATVSPTASPHTSKDKSSQTD